MNATENVKKCFALYCKLDEREVEYLNAMICAKGMLSGVVAEPEEKRRVGRPKGSRNRQNQPIEDFVAQKSTPAWNDRQMDGTSAAALPRLGSSYVNHKDGDPANIALGNLEILDYVSGEEK